MSGVMIPNENLQQLYDRMYRMFNSLLDQLMTCSWLADDDQRCPAEWNGCMPSRQSSIETGTRIMNRK